jgi:hypothetical protein
MLYEQNGQRKRGSPPARGTNAMILKVTQGLVLDKTDEIVRYEGVKSVHPVR